MTHREYVENIIGKEILHGCDDVVFDFYYKAMHDYGMDFADADRYAWLNTLFGYDIGAERAQIIIDWYWDKEELSVMELNIGDRETLEYITRFELGLYLNYSHWPKQEPQAIKYDLPHYI